MPASTAVKFFKHNMTGAPTLSGTTGALIALLDACLIDGFNLSSVATLTVSTGVATVTVSAGHGFELYQVVTIAGATPSGLNGEQRITEILSTTQFTFDTTEGDTTATGTITVKASPVGGWQKAYSATNKAVYQSTDGAATGFYLLVEDDGTHIGGARSAMVRGWESTSDTSDSGTGPFPDTTTAANGWSFYKSYDANSNAKEWGLVGDSLAFYLSGSCRATYEDNAAILAFGDFPSYRAGDGYNCMLVAQDTNWTGYTQSPYYGTYWASINNISSRRGMIAARPYTGVAGAQQLSCIGGIEGQDYSGDGTEGSDIFTYPHPVDNGFWTTRMGIREDTFNAYRGTWPGIFVVCHKQPLSRFQLLDAIGEDQDRVGMELSYARQSSWTTTGYGQVLVDVIGPWR